MQNFENTNKKIDNLIDKLQANVGGQNTNNSETDKPKQAVGQKPNDEVKKSLSKYEVKEEKVKKSEENKIQKAPEKKSETNEVQKEKPKAQKTEKKQKEQPKKQENAQIGPKDFAMIDMRIGQIVECWKHPESQNLYCEKISVCGEVREIASGLQKYVPIDQMKGNVIVMVNLKPRPLAGFQSNGMVVCQSSEDHTKVNVLRPEGAVGERIMLEGFEDLFECGKILPVLNPKKKVLEKCLQHFKTDEEGFVVWKGIRCRTKAAPIKGLLIKGRVS